MEEREQTALYSAIQGFVGNWWNGSNLYPDPCGWTPIQARIEEKMSSGGENMEIIEEILGEAPSEDRPLLVGRKGYTKKKKESRECSVGTSHKTISDEAVEQIKAAVREEMRNEVREEVEKTLHDQLRNEVREEMEKTMQVQFATIIQRLGQLNPTLVLDSLNTTVDSLTSNE